MAAVGGFHFSPTQDTEPGQHHPQFAGCGGGPRLILYSDQGVHVTEAGGATWAFRQRGWGPPRP
jgi:hypothetical protein